MGEELIGLLRTRISREEKNAFLTAFVFSLLVHLYKFTNTLLNHDAMYNVYTQQNMVGSGRWALKYACGISSYYDLPWVIGLLCCVYIALTAMIIVRLFRVKNPVVSFLCGGFLASSPATIETIFFQFTADGYFLAMVLAALAVYLSRVEEKRLWCYLLSGACICVCCGIYQAYVSFALILAVCHMIHELLRNRNTKKEYFLWVARQVVIFGGSLAVYYVLWQKVMDWTGIGVNAYQGIDQLGGMSLDLLRHGWNNAVSSVTYYLFQFALWGNGWSFYSMLNVLLLGALALGLVVAAVKSKLWQRPWALVLIVLGLLAVIPFAGMWCFTSYTVSYRPLMLQSLMVLFLFTAIVYQEWTGPVLKNAAALLLTIIVLHNALLANISYFYMNLCYERTYADAVEMAGEIHDLGNLEDFADIAVLGNRYNDVQWGWQNGDGTLSREGRFYILTCLLEENLLVDEWQVRGFLDWFLNIQIPTASPQRCSELTQDPRVQQMPAWPAEGSIALVDETLVIKLSELQ